MLNLTNIGTLFAFLLVCIGIPILRYKDPLRVRPFRVPFGPWLMPMLGAVSCVFLMYYLSADTWWRFIGWLVLGLAVYLAYGYTRSAIGMKIGRPKRTPMSLKMAALGFLLLAAGLFTVPHDIGFKGVFHTAFTAGVEHHGRALAGVVLIAVGLVLGILGSIMGTTIQSNGTDSVGSDKDL
jgi:hypothetical protein